MRWTLAAVLFLPALAGCIQVDMPQAAAGSAEAALPPSHFPVTCVLSDGAGAPLPSGTCDYRFGSLGSKAAVDLEGTVVRDVPAGATGTLVGTAPGHAAAKATFAVDGPKTVRMTLPALGSQPADGNGTDVAPGNATADPAAPSEPEEPEWTYDRDNVTVHHEVRYDLLFEKTFVPTPAPSPTEPPVTFTVGPDYDRIQLQGDYETPNVFAAAEFDIVLIAPDGSTVARFHEDYGFAAVAVGVGDGIDDHDGDIAPSPFPIAYVPAMPGDYTLHVTGVSAPPLKIQAHGLAGAAPDFTFFDIAQDTDRELSDLFGQVIIVDLMATWCVPCQEQMPILAKVKADYAPAVEVLSVDVDQEETADQLRAFRETYEANWTFGMSGYDSGIDQYESGAIPTLVVIDQHGGLMFRHIGVLEEDQLRQLIESALKQG